MELFGYLSGILFNLSGLFATIRTIRQGHADDMMTVFLLPWVGGSLSGIIYAVHLGDLPMILNFGFGGLFGLTILRYKYGRRTRKT